MDTLLVGGTLATLVGALYLVVGVSVARASGRRRSVLLFAVFWTGVGGYALTDAAWVFLARGGASSLALGIVILQLKILLISAGFFGLVAYLMAIYFGHAVTRQVGALYVSIALFVGSVYALRGPIGAHAGTWGMQLDYARPSVEPFWTAMLALLMVPPMIAALAYAGLWRVSSDAAQRRRILATSASLLLFFVPAFLLWRDGNWYWHGLVEKILSIGAALGMLATARATSRTRASDTAHLASARRERARERKVELRERMLRLV